MKIKIVFLVFFIYVGFSDLIGDLFNEEYYQPPEKWLMKSMGVEATKNSLNLYIGDAWGIQVYAVMSIKEGYVNIISPEKNIFQIYEFKPVKISIDTCKKLMPVIGALDQMVSGQRIDEAILKKIHERGFSLDGPTLTLTKFDSKNILTNTWSYRSTPIPDELTLANEIYDIAEACNQS